MLASFCMGSVANNTYNRQFRHITNPTIQTCVQCIILLSVSSMLDAEGSSHCSLPFISTLFILFWQSNQFYVVGHTCICFQLLSKIHTKRLTKTQTEISTIRLCKKECKQVHKISLRKNSVSRCMHPSASYRGRRPGISPLEFSQPNSNA